MNSPLPRFSDTEKRTLYQLVYQLCHDEAASDVATQIESLVHRRADGPSIYAHAIDLVVGLQWRFGSEGNVSANLVGNVSQTNAPAPVAPTSFIHGLRVTPRLVALAASVLLIGYFVALAGLLVWDRSHPSDLLEGLAVQSSVSQFAKLIRTEDCQWEASSPPAAVGEWLSAREISLRAGVAEIQFAEGATITVEGPAKLEVQGPGRGFLHIGNVAASVPPQAIGFTLATPTIQVVDLGTEFGVEVDSLGQTAVEVITGKVDIYYKPSPTARKTIRMTAGTAKRFSNRDGAAIAVDVTPRMKSRLTQSSPLAIPKESQHDAVPKSYSATILAEQPLGYWRFSDNNREVAADSSGNARHGRYGGSLRQGQPGICPQTNDHSIRVLGDTAPGWVEIEAFELPATFTFEIWVRSAQDNWSGFDWLLITKGERALLVNPHDGTTDWDFHVFNGGERHFLGNHHPSAIADRFHHYAGSYDAASDLACLYFDGVVVDQKNDAGGPLRRLEAKKFDLLVGVAEVRGGLTRCGDAWIDELALYGRVLSAEAVRRHYEAAGYSPASQSSPKSK